MKETVKCAKLDQVFHQERLNLQVSVGLDSTLVLVSALTVNLDSCALTTPIINTQFISQQRVVSNVLQEIIAQEVQLSQINVQRVHIDKKKRQPSWRIA